MKTPRLLYILAVIWTSISCVTFAIDADVGIKAVITTVAATHWLAIAIYYLVKDINRP